MIQFVIFFLFPKTCLFFFYVELKFYQIHCCTEYLNFSIKKNFFFFFGLEIFYDFNRLNFTQITAIDHFAGQLLVSAYCVIRRLSPNSLNAHKSYTDRDYR